MIVNKWTFDHLEPDQNVFDSTVQLNKQVRKKFPIAQLLPIFQSNVRKMKG